jgi:hypothetical protein
MALTYVGIKQKEVDIAGKWRVWVIYSNEEIVMFKFQYDPTDAEVEEVAKDYLNYPPLSEVTS